ncbi:Beta-1,6-galactosyltransferase GALT31A [Vitis vinifera]|uniref:Hexosyltransferase n=1 Tax=Vitis vinifera TaxID=29760 RepID=A0A438BV82_VITVI|nr:Beta-1,6-galactosyltransferase GALT31A [Vitis vinifera]
MGLMPGSRGHKAANGVSTRWVSVFCIASFCFGVLVINRFSLCCDSFSSPTFFFFFYWNFDSNPDAKCHLLVLGSALLISRICIYLAEFLLNLLGWVPCVFFHRLWVIPDPVKIDEASSMKKNQLGELQPIVNCDKKDTSVQAGDILSQVSQTHDVIMTLDKTISSLEMQLAAARASKGDGEEGSPMVTKPGTEQVKERQKELKKLEKEKGIIIRFVIGHSATPGGVLDRTIDAEETQHKDFLRLNHIEGYHELSSKTQIYFSTAVARWDADFYIKVDDDVHINLGMVGSTLARHRSKPRVYTGCMKSGPVLSETGVKYHEPEYWKFGEEGNKYFRHATGQIYAISKDLATYISVNRHILHRYANEDVSLGSWFIGLDVEHIDDRSFCCGSPPGKLLPDNVATCL